MNGVISVKTDTVNHLAEVVFDDSKTDVEQMKNLLAENGYAVESVRNEQSTPSTDAGPDRDAEPGMPVMLDGSASSDPDGRYRQISLGADRGNACNLARSLSNSA